MQANLCTNLPFPVTEANKREGEGRKPYAFTNIHCYQIWKQISSDLAGIPDNENASSKTIRIYTNQKSSFLLTRPQSQAERVCYRCSGGPHLPFFLAAVQRGSSSHLSKEHKNQTGLLQWNPLLQYARKAWPHQHMVTQVTKAWLASIWQIDRRKKGGRKKNLPKIMKLWSLTGQLLSPYALPVHTVCVCIQFLFFFCPYLTTLCWGKKKRDPHSSPLGSGWSHFKTEHQEALPVTSSPRKQVFNNWQENYSFCPIRNYKLALDYTNSLKS